MSQALAAPSTPFTDRRNYDVTGPTPGVERRQFANSHDDLSPAARDLALAIDEYKVRHRRRFITYEEMLRVIEALGYRKTDEL
jgi:hypothetical protein